MDPEERKVFFFTPGNNSQKRARRRRTEVEDSPESPVGPSPKKRAVGTEEEMTAASAIVAELKAHFDLKPMRQEKTSKVI